MLQDDCLKERASAFLAILDWQKKGTLIREHSLSPFAKELALGVCRRHLLLLYAIRKCTRRMPKVEVQCALELGIYQLFFLERVPQSAAVNTCVELVRRTGQGEGAVKLANGILRKLEREGLPELPAQNVRKISLENSLPEWLARRLLDFYGKEIAEEIAAESVQRPSQWIRVNTGKTSAEKLKADLKLSGRIFENRYLEIPDRSNEPHLGELLKGELFAKGFFSVQNPAAYEVVKLLDVQNDSLVWDACAAPGGKTALVAEMFPTARILASDVSEERLRAMQDLHGRLGLQNVQWQALDVRDSNFDKKFDRVLLDVPCSNLGVFSRRPEAKYRLTPEDFKTLPVLQLQILEQASRALKAGGILVYATCSPDRAETDHVVEKFLNVHADYEKAGSPVRIEKNPFGMDRFFAIALRRVK